MPSLSSAEIEQARTQSELRAWADDVQERFGRTEEGRRAMRLKQDALVKKFMEEVWPLALFADAFYPGATDVLFKPVLPRHQQAYDALIIESPTQRRRQYLQITQALDGYQEHLRMLHLSEYGRAPRTRELKKQRGSKHVEESWGESIPHKLALDQTFAEIKAAVLKKSKMRYEDRTSLIVEFDDWCIHSEEDQHVLDDWSRRELVAIALNFADIYLVSDRERLASLTDVKRVSG